MELFLVPSTQFKSDGLGGTKTTGFLVQILKTLYLSVFKTPQNLRLTLVAGEFGYGDDGESGQVVGHFLLVGLVAGLDPALVQSVVVLEHK